MRLRIGTLGVLVAFAGAIAIMVGGAGRAAAAECGNEAIREEQHATFLPDCRAYEMVSPPGAAPFLGPSARGHANYAQASSLGGAAAWLSYYPLPDGEHRGMYLLSRRQAGGWATESVIPQQSSGEGILPGFQCVPSMVFSADLSMAVLSDGFESVGLEHEAEQYCEANSSPLIGEAEAAALEAEGFRAEPEGFENQFLRENATGAYRLLNLTPQGEAPRNSVFQDASANFESVLFSEAAKLTPGAPAGEDLYLWHGGKVRLVTYLPDGAPVQGALANGVTSAEETGYQEYGTKHSGGTASYTHAVSADGSRVFFEAEGKLFVRLNAYEESSGLEGAECVDQSAKACTVQIDVPEAGGEGGGGEFMVANASGSTVYFIDEAGKQLTGDTEPGSGANLYEYTLATGALRDLTGGQAAVDVLHLSGFGEGAEGGAHLYFVAEGALAGADAREVEPVAGKPNLYVVSDGKAPVFIATLNAGEDGGDWGGSSNSSLAARTSADGSFFAFNSVEELTGFDNRDAVTGEPDMEVFLYDSTTGDLACVSCAPGRRPIGRSELTQRKVAFGASNAVRYLPRNVLNSGQVFFDSPNALVEGDSNGVMDVYEYRRGAVRLISSGLSSSGAYFVDASGKNPATGVEGEDVLFLTSQGLLRRDTDGGLSLYDARAAGGFAEPPAPSAECGGEECKAPPPSAPLFTAPPSGVVGASGNLQAPAKAPAAATKQANKAKKAKTPTRRQRLRKALRRCKRLYRHNRHRRRACKRRVRRRYRAKAHGARHHRHHGDHGHHGRHHGRRSGGGK